MLFLIEYGKGRRISKPSDMSRTKMMRSYMSLAKEHRGTFVFLKKASRVSHYSVTVIGIVLYLILNNNLYCVNGMRGYITGVFYVFL